MKVALGWVLTILGWYLVATAAFYTILLPAVVADWYHGVVSVQEILTYILLYILIWFVPGLVLIRWGKRRRGAAAPSKGVAVPGRPDSN